MPEYIRIGKVRKGTTLKQARVAYPVYAVCLVIGPLQIPEIPNSMFYGVWVPVDQYEALKGKIIKPKFLQLLACLGSLWAQFRQTIKSFLF